MSVKALSWALDTSVGDKTAKLILIALADFANENGECWPSQERLARRAECSVRTVQRSLQKLDSDGLISVSRRWADHGYRDASLYILQIPQSANLSPRPRRQSDGSSKRQSCVASSIRQQGVVTRTVSSDSLSRKDTGVDRGDTHERALPGSDDEVPT